MKTDRIAGSRTGQEWLDREQELSGSASEKTWEKAFDDFFMERIEHRYFVPIDRIKAKEGCACDDETPSGAGFSIVVILCSLIEFFQTTMEGRNYEPGVRRDDDKDRYVYRDGMSKEIFSSFLLEQSEFNSIFKNKVSAGDFYKHVRCSLLHEARTTGGWRVLRPSHPRNGPCIDLDAKSVYRDDLYEAIRKVIQQYKQKLLSDTELKQGFIRKFHHLATT